jgi:hypothetical protein
MVLTKARVAVEAALASGARPSGALGRAPDARAAATATRPIEPPIAPQSHMQYAALWAPSNTNKTKTLKALPP